MKTLLLLLLTATSLYAQTDSIAPQNISVVSAEKMNVVYRGIYNPIKIAVPGAVSFEASGDGLEKSEGTGNYTLSPNRVETTTVTIKAVMPDGDVITEEKVFRVLDGIPIRTAVLSNEHSNYYLKTRDELCKDTLNVYFENVLLTSPKEHCVVTEFTVRFFSKKKKRRKTFVVTGNSFSEEVKREIQQLKPGDEVLMHNIKCTINIGVNGLFCKMPMIQIQITE